MGVSLSKRHEFIALQNPSKEFHHCTCSKGRRLPLPSPRIHWESHLSFWTAPRWVHSHHQRTPHTEACMFREIRIFILHQTSSIIHTQTEQHFKITGGENVHVRVLVEFDRKVSRHFTTTIVVAVIFQNVVNIVKYYTIPVQVLHGLFEPDIKQHGTIKWFISCLWTHTNIFLTSFPLPLTNTSKGFYNETGLL